MKQTSHQFIAEVFKGLSHSTRLMILEHLQSGEKSVNELTAALDIDQPLVSQQLINLRNRNILLTRREGTTIFYRVRDETLFELLAITRIIFKNHLIDTKAMLDQLASDEISD